MPSKRRQSFRAWLRAREDEDSPVGDLARDVAADSEWPSNATRDKAHAHLYACGAIPEAHAALNAAYDRWEASR